MQMTSLVWCRDIKVNGLDMTELIVGNPHQLEGRNLAKILKDSGTCKKKAIEIWGYFVLKNLAIWSFQKAVGL